MGRDKQISSLLLIVLLLTAALPASAQEVKGSSATIWVPRLCQLAISGDVTGLLTLIQDGTGELSYDAGHVESAADATILTFNTNDAWDLSARLNGNWVCPGSYDKAENDLYIKISNVPTGTIQSGAGSYINLGGTDTELLSHGSGVTDNAVNIQTKVLLDWSQDIPGGYSITIVYTLVTHVP